MVATAPGGATAAVDPYNRRMEELSNRRFSHEEVGEVIEMATRLQQLGDGKDSTLSYGELRRVAAELGISDEALVQAVAKRLERDRIDRVEAREQARLDAKRRQRVNEWKAHAASYLGVIGGLAAIDLFSGGGFDWFFFPAAGWGIGLAIHTIMVWMNVEPEEDD
jgi:SOS response regulatory protein OraA/RecX